MSNFDSNIIKNPEIFEQNRLAAHSDHVCYKNELEKIKGKSSLRYDMNGLWKFAYAKNMAHAIDGFEKVDFEKVNESILPIVNGLSNIELIIDLFSKDDILELYLNIIFVGGNNINGVELGAEYYFNKDVSQVTIAEAAFMAGINHTPNSYNPYIGTEEEKAAHIENGKKRTKVVLNKMLELGYISQEEFDTANAEVDNGLPFSQGALTSNVILWRRKI